MEYFQKKPFIFRNEVIGHIHVFDCDIEIKTDLSGEIVDYSGCGFKQAKKLLTQLNK
jgi:hypothetical protein